MNAAPRHRRPAFRTATRWLVCAASATVLLFFGCDSDSAAEAERPPRLQNIEPEGLPAEDQVVLALHDMAEILESGRENPKAALERLRAYITANRATLTRAADDIESNATGLSDEARTEYVGQHASEAQSAMERFARAQQAFRAAASAADGIELTDILNTLK